MTIRAVICYCCLRLLLLLLLLLEEEEKGRLQTEALQLAL